MKINGKKAYKADRRVLFRGGAKNGALYAIAILAIVVAFGGMMVGGTVPKILKLQTNQVPGDAYSCCDTGDGQNCHPILEKQISFNGDTYALLKSNIFHSEITHLAPADLAGYAESVTPDGRQIFVNMTDSTQRYNYPGCEVGKDLIRIEDPSRDSYSKKYGACFGVPNEQLIYVCTDTPEHCAQKENLNKIPFDVYFRVSKNEQVPPEITTYCPKPEAAMTEKQQQTLLFPTPSGTPNLQLETFRVKQSKGTHNWLGAWCKPADYFYPTQKTDIHFDVKPKGEFTYTMPKYQQGGWKFTAFPNGNLVYQGKNYPYIYWDAAIPNTLITLPKEGYSVAYHDLPEFLTTLLPKLGLNQKETNDFVEYWSAQLPESAYYFVGIIPQNHIDELAPLSVTPLPDSILRVSLLFREQDAKTTVTAPTIASFERNGFSVVEWGGIFDTQKHPGFSCLM